MSTAGPFGRDLAEDLAVELLMWLLEAPAATGAQLVLGDFVADDEQRAGRADAAARMLRNRGHATLEYTFGAALVAATQAGLAEAERVVRDRGSVDRQLEYLLGELLRQAAGAPCGTVGLGPFRAGTRFLGVPVHPGILDRAVRYLVDRRLARLLMADGKPATLMLTPRGEDCAVSTLTVRQYMNDQQQTAAPAFTQNVYGGAAAQGVAFTQNVGRSETETALLIGRLRVLLSEHGLPGPLFDGDIEVLQDPDQAPARRAGAWRRIRARLLQEAPALAGQAVLLGIDHALAPLLGAQ
ncbi:hypothetical protein ACFXPI_12015 [Streptomyces sp. NPDC059104]|uniref:hypothetical protein n=1 Tax=Streptomyces sp. NPDC059104 TaxID=3346729 RepID=UPI003673F4C7